MKTFWFLFTCIIISGCRHEKGLSPLSKDNLPLQNYQINPEKDTILITKSLARIAIQKGTFSDTGMVTLEVREAVSITDMVLAGLTTVSDSTPLSSGGMIYLNAFQGGKPGAIKQPIQISVPSENYNNEMQLFRGEARADSSLNWVQPEPMMNKEEKSMVIDGQKLFRMNCASCHHLTKTLTGPPLAYVTERRCMAWLKRVTTNTASIIQYDECLKEQAKKYGSVMPVFSNLSDSTIEAIYAYIQAETEKLPTYGKKGDAGKYDPCYQLSVRDTVYTSRTAKTSQTIGKTGRPEVPEVKTPDTDDSASDNFISNVPQEEMPDNYYTFTIDTFGWFNIDIYAGKDPDFVEGKMFLTLTGKMPDHPEVYLIVPSKKIFVQATQNRDGKFYFFYREDGYVQLPGNVTAFVIAFESGKEEALFGKLKFTTSSNLNLTLDLKDNKKIQDEIRSMNLENFQAEITHFTTEKKMLINQRIYRFQCAAVDTLTGPPVLSESDYSIDNK